MDVGKLRIENFPRLINGNLSSVTNSVGRLYLRQTILLHTWNSINDSADLPITFKMIHFKSSTWRMCSQSYIGMIFCSSVASNEWMHTELNYACSSVWFVLCNFYSAFFAFIFYTSVLWRINVFMYRQPYRLEWSANQFPCIAVQPITDLQGVTNITCRVDSSTMTITSLAIEKKHSMLECKLASSTITFQVTAALEYMSGMQRSLALSFLRPLPNENLPKTSQNKQVTEDEPYAIVKPTRTITAIIYNAEFFYLKDWAPEQTDNGFSS